MKIFDKDAFKAGFKRGQMVSIEHPRAIWIPLLIIAVLFLIAFTWQPADAMPAKDDLIQSYRDGSLFKSVHIGTPYNRIVQYIPAGVNDCYNRYYRIAVYGNSITPEILHDSINKVNPFFHIAVVNIDDSMYSFDSSGEIYCKQPYTIIIAHTNGAYRGVSKGRGCVTIYIPYSFQPRIDGLSRLITHECCHDIQTDGNIDAGYPLEKCISDYSRECSGWNTKINIINTAGC